MPHFFQLMISPKYRKWIGAYLQAHNKNRPQYSICHSLYSWEKVFYSFTTISFPKYNQKNCVTGNQQRTILQKLHPLKRKNKQHKNSSVCELKERAISCCMALIINLKYDCLEEIRNLYSISNLSKLT